jgi:hypothetical protein
MNHPVAVSCDNAIEEEGVCGSRFNKQLTCFKCIVLVEYSLKLEHFFTSVEENVHININFMNRLMYF